MILLFSYLAIYCICLTALIYRLTPHILLPFLGSTHPNETGCKRTDLFWIFGFLLLMGGLSLFQFGIGLLYFGTVLFATLLVWLSYIDLRQFLLPHILTIPLILTGLGQSYFAFRTGFTESAMGAVAGYGVLWLVATTYKLIRKKEGMGGGDFTLLAGLGAWCGIWLLPMIIFAAAFIGIFIGLFRKWAMRIPLSEPFPFGPALCIAGFVMLLYGQNILSWYLSFFAVR